MRLTDMTSKMLTMREKMSKWITHIQKGGQTDVDEAFEEREQVDLNQLKYLKAIDKFKRYQFSWVLFTVNRGIDQILKQ